MSCPYPLASNEYATLQIMYDGLGGTQWNWQKPFSTFGNPWNFSEYDLLLPCKHNWQGITCKADAIENSCLTTELSLDNFNLCGQLPPSIGNLTNINTLSLFSNCLTGTIPTEVGLLSAVETLYLYENSLTGTIPTEFGLLLNMENLYLYQNSLTGRIPTESGLLSNMEILYLNSNSLSGRIPTELGLLLDMVIFDVEANSLTGTIPSEMGLLFNVSFFYLSSNSLTGTIPTEVGLLTNMKELQLNVNFLSGTIPTELGLMFRMEILELLTNFVSGCIPTEIGLLSSMKQAYLSTNVLSGTIPTELGSLSHLVSIILSTNSLTGTIPTEFGLLSHATTVDFTYNSLTGSIPTELGLLSTVEVISFEANSISGTIPTELGLLSKLGQLSLNTNELSGTIPTEFGSFIYMEYLYLNSNSLTGIIPTELGLLDVVALSLYSNCLTGTIPTELKLLLNIRYFYLNSNFLTGTIPTELGLFSTINTIELNSNFLTDAIPTELGLLSNLEVLYLYSNSLTNTLPPLGVLPHLLVLDVHDNALTGPLDSVFSDHSFPTLIQLDISDNGFSSSFPSALFSRSALLSLSATNNCFSGYLVCNDDDNEDGRKSLLQVIDLSGLSSGTGCRHYVSNVIPNSGYYPSNYMKGSIPSCVWSFPNLTTLYLLGNGFTGPIPNGVSVPQSLVNLSLAFNQLSGSIPKNFQGYQDYQYLDLSFNRLSGVLLDDFTVIINTNNSAEIILASNRISGPLPPSNKWAFVVDIESNILDGNLFSFTPSDIGSTNGDSGELSSDVYNGSTLLDIALLATTPLLLLTVVVGLLSVSNRHGILATSTSHVRKWWSAYLEIVSVDFASRYLFVSRLAICVLGSMLSVSVLYLCMKLVSVNYSTHTYQYGWLVSVVYFHGVAPIIILVCLITLFVLASLWQVHTVISFKSSSLSNDNFSGKDRSYWTDGALMSAMLILNCCIMGTVNGLYLVAVLHNNPFLQAIEAALAVIKLGWNYLLDWLGHFGLERKQTIPTFQYIIQFINFILIPCFASSVIESSCFLQLFQQVTAPRLTSTHCVRSAAQFFHGVGVVCVANQTTFSNQDIAFEPPFTYSYQCGSAIIANYAPVLLYSYVISGLAIPLGLLLFFMLDNYCVTHRTVTNLVRLPRVLIISEYSSKSEENANERRYSPLVPVTAIIDKCLLNVTIGFTFGLAYPFLILVIVCSSVGEIGIWMLAVGRYKVLLEGLLTRPEAGVADDVELSSNQNKSQSETVTIQVREEVDLCFQGTSDVIRRSIPMMICVVYFFWGVISFDMVADVAGTNAGLAAMFSIMIGGPIVVLGVVWFVVANFLSQANECDHPSAIQPSLSSLSIEPNSIELTSCEHFNPITSSRSSFAMEISDNT